MTHVCVHFYIEIIRCTSGFRNSPRKYVTYTTSRRRISTLPGSSAYTFDLSKSNNNLTTHANFCQSMYLYSLCHKHSNNSKHAYFHHFLPNSPLNNTQGQYMQEEVRHLLHQNLVKAVFHQNGDRLWLAIGFLTIG